VLSSPGRPPAATTACCTHSCHTRPLAWPCWSSAPAATLTVVGGQLALGTWQSLALVDLNVDNADRQVRLSFLG